MYNVQLNCLNALLVRVKPERNDGRAAYDRLVHRYIYIYIYMEIKNKKKAAQKLARYKVPVN